jgi:hypothetical protein
MLVLRRRHSGESRNLDRKDWIPPAYHVPGQAGQARNDDKSKGIYDAVH